LTHIKGGAGARRDGAAMAQDADGLIDSALRAARTGDWAAYRLRFAELRASCAALIERDEGLRQQFETLGAAVPQYDPDGCRAAFESLAGQMRAQYGKELRAACTQPPAPLDLRGLQPPEPIVRIFEALDRAPGEPLRAILPHEPVPLYALLRERGYTYSGGQRPDGGYELLIERS
jgi:TusA-related sulfurtransferase